MGQHSKIIAQNDRQGKLLSIAGNEYSIIISGAQTDGKFAIIDMAVPPGGGPVPHAHPDFQESFYVLEGEVDFKTETEHFVAKKGAFVSIPLGGIVHRFKNLSDTPARLLCTVVPAGLDDFFVSVAEATKSIPPGSPPDDETKAKLAALAAESGQTLYPPDYLDK